MTPEERADAIARGAEWSRDEYLRDPDGNEYPNAVVDLDALARLIADAIRQAVEAERARIKTFAAGAARQADAALGASDDHGDIAWHHGERSTLEDLIVWLDKEEVRQ
jgi:hypothetical protein